MTLALLIPVIVAVLLLVGLLLTIIWHSFPIIGAALLPLPLLTLLHRPIISNSCSLKLSIALLEKLWCLLRFKFFVIVKAWSRHVIKPLILITDGTCCPTTFVTIVHKYCQECKWYCDNGAYNDSGVYGILINMHTPKREKWNRKHE